MEGVSTAKIVLFHQGSTELRWCENCIFFLPVNILTGVTRRLLGPHDTLPCVLIYCVCVCVYSKSKPLEKKKLSQTFSALISQMCMVILLT